MTRVCSGFNLIPHPCPYVMCRYYLEAPDASCALDVANQGEHTQGEVADLLGCSCQRVQQIEVRAIRKLCAGLYAIGRWGSP